MAERFINAAKDGRIDRLREATRRDLNTGDDDGMTATMWAASSGNLEALRLIVGREGDVNKADLDGMTSLHHACLRGHMDVVSYLVNWGCNMFALDNDMQSALDIAFANNRNDIVRFLDGEAAQKVRKNPRQVTKLKEEAVKIAEINQKKRDKMVEQRRKADEKQQRKSQQANLLDKSDNSKKSFFKTLTIRLKGNKTPQFGNTRSRAKSGQGLSTYSDMAGMTTGRNRTGVAKKIQMKKTDSSNMTQKSVFKVSEVDDSGNRTVRSLGASQGYFGSMSEVMYLNNMSDGSADTLGATRRPVFDVFKHNSRAVSEPNLTDPNLYDERDDHDDDDKVGSMFFRPQFGNVSFFKKPFVDTLQSFTENQKTNGDLREHEDSLESYDPTHNGLESKDSLAPFDDDYLDALEDDETSSVQGEFSAVETFLWAAGLADHLNVFTQEKIDFELLVNMSDSALKDLGLRLGPRIKLEEAIKRRKKVLSTSAAMTDSFL